MAYNDTPLKNVSVVEFALYNRTSRQFNDFELIFSVNDSKFSSKMVSGGIITPNGLPQSEIVNELKTTSSLTKKYNIKVFPQLNNTEFYHAVFVFEGESAPKMSVVGLSKNGSIIEYQTWKDNFQVYSILFGILFVGGGVWLLFVSLIEYYTKPATHKKDVEKFVEFSVIMKNSNKLESNDSKALADAGKIYSEYKRPKVSVFWSKFLGQQKYDY
tara:strand:+ start:10587 stop:11231 length:645 start_codon:yes stop_codon:yes gene_type:complete